MLVIQAQLNDFVPIWNIYLYQLIYLFTYLFIYLFKFLFTVGIDDSQAAFQKYVLMLHLQMNLTRKDTL